MMDCETTQHRLSARFDDELPEDEALGVDAHLAACVACRGRLDRIQRVSAVLSSTATGAAPPWLLDRIVAATGRRIEPARAARFVGPLAAAAGFLLCFFLIGGECPDATPSRAGDPRPPTPGTSVDATEAVLTAVQPLLRDAAASWGLPARVLDAPENRIVASLRSESQR